jgi:TRAP-type C4-dicarboxylate transport system permease small subunit
MSIAGPRAIAGLRVVSNTAIILVMAAVLYYSLPEAINDWSRMSPGLGWPMGLFALPIGVMATLSIVHAFPLVVTHMVAFRRGITGDDYEVPRGADQEGAV